MKETIRIIGGQYRGKKLHFPAISGLRPTPDRIKETLFNWLMHDIREAHCLDVFSGSGALGFEAFSRGAGRVTLLEKDNLAYANLLKMSRSFQSEKINVCHTDALLFLKETQKIFDIVFLDPPFASNHIPTCMDILAQTGLLKDQGLVYVESPQNIPMDPALWTILKLKKSGQIVYGLYKKTTTKDI